MKLYRTHEGVWHGTQADAGKKGTWEQVEVPVDKAGLLDFLNRQESEIGGAGSFDGASLEARVAGWLTPSQETTRLNLAPLKHGAGWRESVAGMTEAIALMNLPTALRWAQAAIERVRALVDDDSLDLEVSLGGTSIDNADDLI